MVDNFFNVVIPTRNRLRTLQHSLKTVLNQNYDNYIVVVSDNNSSDGTREYIEGLNCDKIKYYNTGKSLSMSSSFEFAISKINDGFVIVIGDDDGLLQNSLTYINSIINREKVLAISSRGIVYHWPGGGPNENALRIPPLNGRIERKKSTEVIAKVLSGYLQYRHLPILYTGGVVHSSLIALVKSKNNNKFYNSFTPDMYSGFAIASVVGEFARSYASFAIIGCSSYSNGLSQFSAKGNTSVASNFFLENDIPFHPKLGNGKVKSESLLVLEAYMKCDFLRQERNDNIDFRKQFEIAVATSPKVFRAEVIDYLKSSCNFNPAKVSMTNIRIYFRSFIYTLHNIINKYLELLFCDDLINAKSIVNNVYEASLYITGTNSNFIKRIFHKLRFIKLRIFLLYNKLLMGD